MRLEQPADSQESTADSERWSVSNNEFERRTAPVAVSIVAGILYAFFPFVALLIIDEATASWIAVDDCSREGVE